MRRRPWPIVALVALAGVLVLASFPTRAYLAQTRQRDQLARQAAALAAANRQLSDQASSLQSDATVEALARSNYDLVKPGEEAYSILPTSPPSTAPAAAGTRAGAAAPVGPATSPAAGAASPAARAAARPGLLSRLWTKVTSIF